MAKEKFISRWRKDQTLEPKTDYEKKEVRKFLAEKKRLGRKITTKEKVRSGIKIPKAEQTSYFKRIAVWFKKQVESVKEAFTSKPKHKPVKKYKWSKKEKYASNTITWYIVDLGMNVGELPDALMQRPDETGVKAVSVRVRYVERDTGMEKSGLTTLTIAREYTDLTKVRDEQLAKYDEMVNQYDVERITSVQVIWLAT